MVNSFLRFGSGKNEKYNYVTRDVTKKLLSLKSEAKFSNDVALLAFGSRRSDVLVISLDLQ